MEVFMARVVSHEEQESPVDVESLDGGTIVKWSGEFYVVRYFKGDKVAAVNLATGGFLSPKTKVIPLPYGANVTLTQE
jgi:hypothetical protein